MHFVKTEKRRSERIAYPARIEYIPIGDAPLELMKAVTINISSSGLSLYAFAPLQTGQLVVLKGGLPVEQRLCTILWVRQEHESMYKVGLKFVVGKGRDERTEDRT